MTTGHDMAHIGVVVPAHNEEQHLPDCLQALIRAADHARSRGHEVTLVVVLDSCRDRSATIAAEYGIKTVSVAAGNVGMARHTGVLALPEGIDWLAFTDADTCVPEHWLSAQCGAGTDAVCGGVYLSQWQSLPPALRARYLAHQRQNIRREHVHGANLGISMVAYQALSGFRPLRCHEDVDLIERLKAGKGSITWAHSLRVMTSARCQARAPEGLGALLHTLECACQDTSSFSAQKA
ncbi:glycosyl transferase [Kushneria pakistanensis]|uniref:Glycosyl transferase n=1 Tax=Kushneria pakistanensis TaxID=1508770 RepID=A0ABQ3FIY0_9GAMM|nr:glycosyltransferase [Kushneria pakistanensis]GHC25916.1 glycosyl transferase [Kushneria pakistanensis]